MPTDEPPTTSTPPTMDYATPERTESVPRMPSLVAVFLVVGVLLALLLVMPVLNRSKTPALSTQCLSQLHMIDAAIGAYRAESRGHFPPDLMALVSKYLPTDDVFLLPRHKPTAGAWSDDASARAADQMDYIYLGEGLSGNAKNAGPIVVERRSITGNGLRLVLTGDGSFERLDRAAILKLLEPLRGTPRLTQEEYDAIVAQ